MPIYDRDQDPYDYTDVERFYEETVYNEEYYIERERELIRQSNLDLELEELEEKHLREMREEGLLRPVLINVSSATHFPSPCCKRRSPRRIHLKYGNDNPLAGLRATGHTPLKNIH